MSPLSTRGVEECFLVYHAKGFWILNHFDAERTDKLLVKRIEDGILGEAFSDFDRGIGTCCTYSSH